MTDTTNAAMITRADMKKMNVADLLDVQVSNVEELQEFSVVNSFLGTFRVAKCSMEQDDENSYFAMKVDCLQVLEVEANNPHNHAEPVEGFSLTERYYPGFGVQRLSSIVRHLLGADATLRDWLEKAEGLEFNALVKARSRKDKETKEVKHYNELDVHNMQGPCSAE